MSTLKVFLLDMPNRPAQKLPFQFSGQSSYRLRNIEIIKARQFLPQSARTCAGKSAFPEKRKIYCQVNNRVALQAPSAFHEIAKCWTTRLHFLREIFPVIDYRLRVNFHTTYLLKFYADFFRNYSGLIKLKCKKPGPFDRPGFRENLFEACYVLAIFDKPKPTKKFVFLVSFFIVRFWIANIFICTYSISIVIDVNTLPCLVSSSPPPKTPTCTMR
jgi:hypothetical protein